MRYENIKAAAAENLELPKDILLDLPLITITGSSELIIDNFKSLRELSDKAVKINANGSKLTLTGSELSIVCLTKETVIIRGRFESLNFE